MFLRVTLLTIVLTGCSSAVDDARASLPGSMTDGSPATRAGSAKTTMRLPDEPARVDFDAAVYSTDVNRGGSGKLSVRIRRRGYDGRVRVAFEGLPPTITHGPVTIAEGAADLQIMLLASNDIASTSTGVSTMSASMVLYDELGQRLDASSAKLALSISDPVAMGMFDRRVPGGVGYVDFEGPRAHTKLVASTKGFGVLASSDCVLTQYDLQKLAVDPAFVPVALDVAGTCETLERAADAGLVLTSLDGARRIVTRLDMRGRNTGFTAALDLGDRWSFDRLGRMVVLHDGVVTRRDADGTSDQTFGSMAVRMGANVAALDDGVMIVEIDDDTTDPFDPYDDPHYFVATTVSDTAEVLDRVTIERGSHWTSSAGTLWMRALSSGDVLVATVQDDVDSWISSGGLIRLKRPTRSNPHWTPASIYGGYSVGPPTVDWDGALLFAAGSVERGGPPFCEIIRYAPDDDEGAPHIGALGNGLFDTSPYAYAVSFAPVGDGTSVFVSPSPTAYGKEVLVRMRTTP